MTKVILIVDDEPANIDIFKSLTPDSYKCKAAIKGLIALKQISKQKPDMVILDLVMPGMNGIETLSEIRKSYSNDELPVLIVSGTKNPEDLVALEKLGITDFMTKPVNSEQFLAILTKTLGT